MAMGRTSARLCVGSRIEKRGGRFGRLPVGQPICPSPIDRPGLQRMLDGTVRDAVPPDIIELTPRGPRRRRPILWLAIVALALFFGGDTLLSYYVESVWFASLGYG